MRKLNILVAYPYMGPPAVTEFLIEYKDSIRFLLDSGAFTAWKSGNPIKLDDYCKFLDSLPIEPWRYFTLDEIGDPEKSYKNYQTLLKRGYKPMPIFTRGEDVLMIDEYYKTSDVLGIGGLVGTKGNRGFVKGIMQIIGDRKVHWLGFTNKEFLKYYKPYMCDSSALKTAERFGAVEVFNEKSSQWLKLNKQDFRKRPSDSICDLIRSYDMEPKDFAISEKWQGGDSVSANLSYRSHIRASLRYHEKLNVKYFLSAIAEAPEHSIKKLVSAYNGELKRL